jgi:hypothetical protein
VGEGGEELELVGRHGVEQDLALEAAEAALGLDHVPDVGAVEPGEELGVGHALRGGRHDDVAVGVEEGGEEGAVGGREGGLRLEAWGLRGRGGRSGRRGRRVVVGRREGGGQEAGVGGEMEQGAVHLGVEYGV